MEILFEEIIFPFLEKKDVGDQITIPLLQFVDGLLDDLGKDCPGNFPSNQEFFQEFLVIVQDDGGVKEEVPCGLLRNFLGQVQKFHFKELELI